MTTFFAAMFALTFVLASIHPLPAQVRSLMLNREKSLIYQEFSGATRRIRTDDLLITNQLLYRLS